ncbi:MAG: redoxin domain-containing protein [Deltaproteobacteria bacterium]|nr:redoxin domain-containing protein [Deltaproteobacteria bacterium]
MSRRLPVLGLLGAVLAPGATPAETPEGIALHGTRPAAPLQAPEFQVQAQSGEPRTRADLLGRPTVLWFYPMAGTPG